MSEAMYRNLVESVPVAVYIDEGLDESSAIYRTRFMSPQIERMLGYPAEAFEADPELRWSLVHPDDRERAPANDRLHHETGRPTRSALRMIARIKTELVQLLSHELFTPITAIQGTADTLSLAGDRLSAEELHGLGEGVRAAASRLKRLVANLDAVMAVDREAALPTESLRVGEIVERAVAEFADTRTRRSWSFHRATSSGAPCARMRSSPRARSSSSRRTRSTSVAGRRSRSRSWVRIERYPWRSRTERPGCRWTNANGSSSSSPRRKGRAPDRTRGWGSGCTSLAGS
jgi:hypothetical protein